MEVVSVGSSSSGNSYIINAGGRAVILDVGLPAKKIIGALGETGIEPDEVAAVLITHEHTDHVKSVRAIGRKCSNAVFYASEGTVRRTENFKYLDDDRVQLVSAGDCIKIDPADNNVKISVFPLSHDAAEPVGFSLTSGGEKVSVVTDTGVITEEIYEEIKDSDMLVFEANHDEHMLMFGEYPYPVKVRIKSDFGHLSNDYAGEVLARLLEERRADVTDEYKPLRIMLAHLSFHNNMPFIARQTIEEVLSKRGYKNGTDYFMEVAAKEGLTYM